MKYLFLLTLIFSSIQLHSQSDDGLIEGTDNEGDGQTYIISPVESIGPSGPDCIWDFSGLVETGRTTSYLHPLKDRDMATHFPKSNVLIQEGPLTVFLKVTPSVIYEYGYTSGMRTVAYDDPIVRFPIPFEYGSSVQGRYSGKHYTSQIRQLQGEYHTEADGYGTLILPNNTVIEDVIRLKFTKTLDNNLTDEVTYRWYPAGFAPVARYPLLTVFTRNTRGEEEILRAAYYEQAVEFSIQDEPYSRDEESPPVAYTSADAKAYELNVSPNPFSDVAQIEYNLPEKANIKIQVFDQTGRLIETLIEGEEPQGKHTASLRSRGDFIYYVRFSVENEIMVSKKVFSVSVE